MDLATAFDKIKGAKGVRQATAILNFCELFWSLADDEPHTCTPFYDRFVNLVSNASTLSLVRQVIPELRLAKAQGDGIKSEVVSLLKDQKLIGQPTPSQPLALVEQKSRIRAMDMHRARLLMYNRNDFEPEEQAQWEEWLASCPQPKKERSASVQHESSRPN